MKNVLITGANKGIGFELVSIFSQSGWNVYALSRNTHNLEELKSASNHSNISIIKLDITSDFGKILNKEIPIDVLINNAGMLINKPFLETTDKDWLDQINVNLLGPVKIIKNITENLKKSPNPHIVNISSMGGFQGASKFPGLSAYSTTKGALSILTECLATELMEFNIKCNCLCLGAVNTEMLASAFPGYSAPVNASEMAEYIYTFSTSAHKYFNGKIIPVALSNPN